LLEGCGVPLSCHFTELLETTEISDPTNKVIGLNMSHTIRSCVRLLSAWVRLISFHDEDNGLQQLYKITPQAGTRIPPRVLTGGSLLDGRRGSSGESCCFLPAHFVIPNFLGETFQLGSSDALHFMDIAEHTKDQETT
jgi:hypothetical protein